MAKTYKWPGSSKPHSVPFTSPKVSAKATKQYTAAHPKAVKAAAKKTATTAAKGKGKNAPAVNKYLAGRNSGVAKPINNPLIKGALPPMAGENGVIMQPAGTPKGYGVLYTDGAPARYVKLPKGYAPTFAKGQGVQIMGGKAVGFANNRNAMPTPKPTPGGPPVDPLLTQTLNVNQRDFNTGNENLTAERGRTLQGYGYTGQFAPGTDSLVPGSLKFDPTDPYSRAAVLKQNYDEQRRRTGNQMAAAGQRTSGAYLANQNTLIRNQGQAEDTLTKSLGEYLSGVGTQRQSLLSTKTTSDIQAKIDAAGRAVPQPQV